ncbi:DUF7108 family protein [Natrononativus amylolyticus]|uniref:DUF7108 family protein n=1 Tax=Natrononativus amylolyticus TaxID=2963434 RepID=UPI0020CF9625|nr:hypothetical protein [Natrononativus amylolyticus]
MSDSPEPEAGTEELPEAVIEEAERLTRLERTAVDEAEREVYDERRETLLEDHEFTARVREEGADETLVLHPAEWHADGAIRTDRIEDISRAVEVPLEGTADPDDWEAVEAQNRDLVADVRAEHGEVHGENVSALADFMGNHYAKPVVSATSRELAEFRREYFVRNAWPSDEQRATIETSIRLAFETAGESVPEFRSSAQ